MVLIETLEEITRSLPRTCEGANMTRADLYRALPAVLTAWFSTKMEAQLRGNSGTLRTLREMRTLVEVVDDILVGHSMPALMKLIGRIKALAEVCATGRTWEVAQHHELVETDGLGLITRRDRQNAAASQREAQRLASGGRGAAMRSSGRGNA